MRLEKVLADFDYPLPKELIAQAPAKPRESARLLVYAKAAGKAHFSDFAHIGEFLPKNAVLVFNQTRVEPARLRLRKKTGGRVEILYLKHDEKHLFALADRRLNAGDRLKIENSSQSLLVAGKKGKSYIFLPSFETSRTKSLLKKLGRTPLPPYIKNSPLSERQKRQLYQSVFAKSGLSVAAPTASLHFTKKLIAGLEKRGAEACFLTLNVGLGTFAPLTQENLVAGRLHGESYEIPPQTARLLNQAKKQGRPIIAVGTTVIRALESACGASGKITKLKNETRLFIAPGYKFKFITGAITNFHVPKSSLMMLVAALVGKTTLLKLYQQAIKKSFRFFSFGDGMLILP